jgi:hypothetical protein
VTWLAMILFSLGNLAQRMVGMFVLGGRVGAAPRWERLVGLMPVTIVSAVVAIQTFALRGELVVDARVPGVAVAVVASWRRLPLFVVVTAAAATTALLRAAGWD